MGACLSAPGEELPAATDDDMERLKEMGHLPCVATPSVDFEGENQCQTVYVAEYENGCELTFLFLDEDRPNMCSDFVYDKIRRPIFGRYSDIESLLIIGEKVVFPGTYSAGQKWDEKAPSHNETEVDLSSFERKEGELVFWMNTWNHLIGEKNNNPSMDIHYQHSMKHGGVESMESRDFVVRKGSRAEVDARFKGCVNSVSKVMTEDSEMRLGKRIG